MKKVIFIIFLVLITGCIKKITIEEEIININYKEHKIQNGDYSDVINTLKDISFYCGKKNKNYKNFLTISTTNSLIVFSISNNNLGYHQNDQYCYSNNTANTEKLISLLDNIVEKYISDTFYSIEVLQNYEENNNDLNIRLDKQNEYIVITLNDYIDNFKINEIEFKNNKSEEINLIYSKEIINNNKIVIRKYTTENPTYKITFTNKYGYTFNITPIYDSKNNEVLFKTEIK